MNQYLALLREQTDLKIKAGQIMSKTVKPISYTGYIVKQEKVKPFSGGVKRRIEHSIKMGAWESKI